MTTTVSTPEEELLVSLAKPYANERDLARAHAALSRSDFSWSEALTLSRTHRVSAMLTWNLKAHAAVWVRLPKAVRGGVSQSFRGLQKPRCHAGYGGLGVRLANKLILPYGNTNHDG